MSWWNSTKFSVYPSKSSLASTATPWSSLRDAVSFDAFGTFGLLSVGGTEARGVAPHRHRSFDRSFATIPVMAGDLERARDAYARQSWLESYEAFGRADAESGLAAVDLALQSTAALMLGRDDDAIAILDRAHRRFLEDGEVLRAVRAATWIGLNLAYRGAVGPASGWLS